MPTVADIDCSRGWTARLRRYLYDVAPLVRRLAGRRAGGLDERVSHDIAACRACQDYTTPRQLAIGSARRLHAIAEAIGDPSRR